MYVISTVAQPAIGLDTDHIGSDLVIDGRSKRREHGPLGDLDGLDRIEPPFNISNGCVTRDT